MTNQHLLKLSSPQLIRKLCRFIGSNPQLVQTKIGIFSKIGYYAQYLSSALIEEILFEMTGRDYDVYYAIKKLLHCQDLARLGTALATKHNCLHMFREH